MNPIPEPCPHCLRTVLAPEAVTADAIAVLRDQAGIDHAAPENGCVYAYGLGFPSWISVDEEACSITIATHADTLHGIDELTGAHFANHCNATFVLVQFSWSEAGRLCGHYSLPYADGLNGVQLLRSAHRFAAIFAKAVVQGVAAQLLAFPVGEASAPPLLN